MTYGDLTFHQYCDKIDSVTASQANSSCDWWSHQLGAFCYRCFETTQLRSFRLARV